MRRLVVLVPGMSGDLAGLLALAERLKGEPEYAEAHWLPWDPMVRWYSRSDLMQLAGELRACIDQEWVARGPFEDVVLVGHSLGGLLVRQAYLLASGADPLTSEKSEWDIRVSRMVLFAALNRGIDPARTMSLRIANWLARALPPARRLASWHLFRGSEFIANLRIQWIRHFAALEGRGPLVIQLLGTRDELVTRADSVDVEQFATGMYLSIPEATHADLHRLDRAPDPEGRWALIREAFVESMPPHAENVRIEGPEQVVFVLHGIRADNRTWVEETVKTIQKRWPHVHAIGPRYDFVSALAFAVPMRRRKYLRWFQDAYTEALANNPSAEFNFIGHSNGTYLFGESLRALPGMRFKRAALVGSVLPCDYAWDERVRQRQIESVRVDGSAKDWPVGWLCSALRGMGMRDVGTAGIEGFTSAALSTKHEFFWYVGGHSAPLEPSNLPALAEFAVTGQVVPPASLGAKSGWFFTISRAMRRLSPVAVAGAVVALVFLAVKQPPIAAGVLGVSVLGLLALDVG